MAWMTCTGPCICCRRIFSYNPNRVPSTTALTGRREPVCPACMGQINRRRADMGLEPFPIPPGAYDPEEVA